MIYLDHQGGTAPLPEVREAMAPFAEGIGALPSSLHRLGVEARRGLKQAREQVADMVCTPWPQEVVFTGSGTEAANLAVLGAAWASERRHIVVSAIEHPATLKAAAFLVNQGYRVTTVPVDAGGLISPEAVAEAVTDDTVLVAVHLVQHDVGTVQNIAALAEVAHAQGALLYADAIAAAGWVPMDFQALGADLVSLSANRFFGPRGAGALVCRRGVPLASVLHGGEQEGGHRAGSQDLAAIVGMGAAAAAAGRELPHRREHVGGLSERLLRRIPGVVSHVALNGSHIAAQRAPHLVNLSFEATDGEAIALALDMRGVLVHSGASCTTRAQKVPPTLTAMGLPEVVAQGTILLSPGPETTPEEMDQALEALVAVVDRVRSMSALWEEIREGALPAVTPEKPDWNF